jgi:nitrogenase molybdenum-cofactor synthesis protein NifE
LTPPVSTAVKISATGWRATSWSTRSSASAPAPWPESTPFAPEQRHDIGLIGEFNIAGEFWHIQPLLDELGIRVLGSLSGDGRFAEIQTMHRAQANMLVCSRALINVATLEQRYGTPWFEGSFYGIRATSDALRQLAALLGDDDLIASAPKR